MMADLMTPFTRTIDLATGTIPDAVTVTTRTLADMRGLFADADAERARAAEDPLIYRVFEAASTPEVEGQLRYSTTVISPGRIGDEFFMTKGHFHAKGDRAEFYLGLAGTGLLLMQTPGGEVNVQHMTAGSAAYVPPHWGHRTVNVGDRDFVFLAVYPADAGYDYATIETEGFASIVVAGAGEPLLVPNPHYRRRP